MWHRGAWYVLEMQDQENQSEEPVNNGGYRACDKNSIIYVKVT